MIGFLILGIFGVKKHIAKDYIPYCQSKLNADQCSNKKSNRY